MMRIFTFKEWRAFSVLTGTIIGAGIFAIPYVSSQAGFFIGLLFLVVTGGIMTVTHLLYGEVVMRTNGRHRLIGFVSLYLGTRMRHFVFVALTVGVYGALLAYIILGGTFLSIIVSSLPGGVSFSSDTGSLLFFAAGSLFILWGLRAISRVELFLSFFLIGSLVAITLIVIPSVKMGNFFTFNISHMFLPYGVILFSLAGTAAIPELKDILEGGAVSFKRVVIAGTIVPAILYALFAFSVVGVAGSQTTPDALVGLGAFFGEKIVWFGAWFGFVAVFTSFLVIGINLRETFWYDYGINRYVAWILAVGIPFALFTLGIKDLISVVEFAGAVMGGVEGIFVIFIYQALRKREGREGDGVHGLRVSTLFRYVLVGVFSLGILYQIVYFFRG